MSGLRIPGRVDSSGTRACGLMMSCYSDTASATGSAERSLAPILRLLRAWLQLAMTRGDRDPAASIRKRDRIGEEVRAR